MKNKSIGRNALINGIKTVLSVLFPLITMPYITRVLQVDNVGKFNFACSIMSYFYLIANLGIATYAVREGAKYRDNKELISKFASEVFTINVISALTSLVFLFGVAFGVSFIVPYRSLILVMSINIIFTTIGCEWILSIYEEYFFLAVRSIIFQIVSLLLMFVLVREQNDVIKYAIIGVISTSGSGLLNLSYVKKKCDLKIVISNEIIKHVKPIMLIFANTITTTIYISSDTTILGIISGDYYVGIYSIATKVYSIIKSVIAAIIIVSIPRLSYYWGEKDRANFSELANNIFSVLITIGIPAMVGLFFVSPEIVMIIADKAFLPAYVSLRILSVSLLFSLFSWFYTSCILIPTKLESTVLASTISAAVINIALNIILIPRYNEHAAAFTTLVAEVVSLIMCAYFARKTFKPQMTIRNLSSVLVGSIYIVFVCYIIRLFVSNSFLVLLLSILFSGIGYLAILVAMRNSTLTILRKLLIKRK